MVQKHRRYDAGSFLIAVDSYENGEPRGLVYQPYRHEVGSFGSLTQLLLRMEQNMDAEECPQSFQCTRSFFPLQGLWEERGEHLLFRSGRAATFSLQVLFRRNSSWQGSVTWMEGGQTERFRSVLELIALMNSAMVARQMRTVMPQKPPLELAE